MGISHLVSIVGAGPGDPELLTVKAYNRLKEADVVLYDGVMGNGILNLKEITAEKIYVGKLCMDGQNQVERQQAIFELFLLWAKKNKRIVRLKAGDPMIFGRGAEEIRFCKMNRLNYEVIPGITAGVAGSSLLEVPLTERGKSCMTLFCTGQRQNGRFADINAIVGVIKTGGTVVNYMALNSLADLSFEMIKAGVSSKTPMQILSKISQVQQSLRTTTLGKISELMLTSSFETPSIIILGKHATAIN